DRPSGEALGAAADVGGGPTQRPPSPDTQCPLLLEGARPSRGETQQPEEGHTAHDDFLHRASSFLESRDPGALIAFPSCDHSNRSVSPPSLTRGQGPAGSTASRSYRSPCPGTSPESARPVATRPQATPGGTAAPRSRHPR